MDGQNWIGLSHDPTLVDNFLRSSLNFGVATLHRVEIEIGRIGARSHGAGRTAAHADEHAGAAQLNEQGARRKLDLLGLDGINDA